MRILIAPLAVVTTLGAAGLATADTTVGTIADVDSVTGNLSLQNGMAFDVDRSDANRLDPFKPGDTVSVTWVAVGDANELQAISPVSGSANEMTGVVADADATTGALHLANGMTVDLAADAGDEIENFKPGDTVSIKYVSVGDEIRALSVSPAAAPANRATGIIADVSEATGMVTLADGSAYDFRGMDRDLLDRFNEGDRVAVNYVTEGDALVALSIAPVS